MANCPNCGSNHIQLKKETNVSWGRAAAGWALFGVVGAAVGAVTGEDRNVNACLDCGTSWKAADLYNVLQRIESLTGAVLDLSVKKHRAYLNNFMTDVISCYEEIAIADKEAERLFKEIENVSTTVDEPMGCGIAPLGAFVGFGISAISGLPITFLFLPVIGFLVGMRLGTKLKDSIKETLEQQAIEKRRQANEKKRQATEMKIQAREKYERALDDFIANHPLN
ncbi:hypothetical protein F7734_33190 [Scytonema sp. UIC 10036]|uniref:hypothetical protein n=1 Tax=Scytonema sp. UIC 10036 TaxID=2304196 RepID=UPI0012DAC80E|nr:hypothetical protein [Scytonema sp. UIC 10036]MUG96936.1 hypothetical protein [Scytonema sp. UIC 10036]